jgi:uncharacterized protein YjgD (DUF1641 family)
MNNDEKILERLARIEERLEGVSRLETQLAAFSRPFENLSDLGRDLSLLMEPSVRKLTEEMVEEQLENLVDWWQDMEPVMKIAVPKIIDYLDSLEQKGIFRINGAVIEMYGKIAATYQPEDIEAMGDGFVRMHGLVRKLSNPRLIQFLEKLADVPAEVRLEEAKPVGPMGLAWKMRSQECRQGLGIMLELTRALGKLAPAPEEAVP